MNTYYFDDENFVNTMMYREFIMKNPSQGSLKIRAYAASQAIPIQGLRIVVSTMIGNDRIIFFDGYTDKSGVIERIILPAPRLNQNDMEVPLTTTYDITATYTPDNVSALYKVNMYENICVVQNINIVPDINTGLGVI